VLFDLDGTLHDYRKASAAAMDRVYALIEQGTGCPREEQVKVYNEVLRSRTAAAFVCGRRGVGYRRERFTDLAERLRLPSMDLSGLESEYSRGLAENLTLYSDVPPTLDRLRESRVRVAIVSEGPHDAQIDTISRLGIGPFVDHIFTSGECKISKPDGLYRLAIAAMKDDPQHVLVVGDSLDRDVIPANKSGACGVLIDRSSGTQNGSATTTIFSLLQLFDGPYEFGIASC